MTFEEILDQAIAMLQRRGRVSYRTLMLQFHLDEESLAALKEELLEVHHLAVDHGGRMLVWAGEAQTTSGAPAPQPPQQAIQHEDHPTQVAPFATPRSADAERRQLTVLFCDLVLPPRSLLNRPYSKKTTLLRWHPLPHRAPQTPSAGS